MNTDKAPLRQHYRQRRQALSPAQRLAHAEALATQLSQDPTFQNAQHIALYQPLPEEIPTEPLFTMAFAAQKTCYVPRIATQGTLAFIPVTEETTWKPNKYSILEPEPSERTACEPQDLDLILMPLVSFDLKGTRLGMGAGFYDKTLAFKRTRKKPCLMGLAFACQEHPDLPSTATDVPLDAIATETYIKYF